MKWPGLIPLVARIISLPFALLFACLALIYALIEEGIDWWRRLIDRKF